MKIQIEVTSLNENIDIFLSTEDNIFLCNGKEVKKQCLK